jgi:hypothetical protein
MEEVRQLEDYIATDGIQRKMKAIEKYLKQHGKVLFTTLLPSRSMFSAWPIRGRLPHTEIYIPLDPGIAMSHLSGLGGE